MLRWLIINFIGDKAYLSGGLSTIIPTSTTCLSGGRVNWKVD
jgi:hypothetical protein